MDRTKALIAAVAFAAGTGGGVAISQPRRDLQVVNIKLVRSERDGGWHARACAYDLAKSADVKEPCWHAPVDVALVAPIEAMMLESK